MPAAAVPTVVPTALVLAVVALWFSLHLAEHVSP
ncbi:hypothetical protein SAMN04489712_103165 [Thermomonospora echinospora]|uniref:Uncharacterized protein n=1 Tax=Thermomonospora echinospora TaxID=1992 RepID=A0A1H5XB92_9ACTN|nr:hypothetical protein SAMN04489712_103165 [Thermomonospora echinospora]